MNETGKFIKTDEHVFICGANGTGKTMLAKAYLSGYSNVIVLDSKGTFKFEPFHIEGKSYRLVTDINMLYNESSKFKKLVYRPNIYQNNQVYYERFFEFCYCRQNTIILIDEAMHICDAHKIGFWYKACLTRGRELNVTCWSCTQRPTNVSQFIMTEAIHWFVFRLNNAMDRDKLYKNSGIEIFRTSRKGYNFYYWNANTNIVKKRILNLGGIV